MPDVFELTTLPARRALVDALEERSFGVELLDDALDDPVGVSQPGHAVVERARGNELRAVG
jgi:hypothetical protein